MAKKYYWLKLKNNFFSQPKIKKLRKIAGGDTYTIIYLKMQLYSLEDDGKLYFDGIEENFVEEMALKIDEDPENVGVTIQFLIAQGLMILREDDEYLMTETQESIGSESDSAQRVRAHRERKALHCNDAVTLCNTEIEKEIEKEIEIRDRDNIYDCAEAQKPQKKMKREKPMKHKYGEYNNVLLTDDELCKLKEKFPDWEDRIDRLSGYIESKGAKYKSHYATILNWARREGNAGRTVIKSSMPKNTGYAPEQDMNDLDDLF